MVSPIFTAIKQKEFVYELIVTQADITPYGRASFVNFVRWYGIVRDALLRWHDLGFNDSLKGEIEIIVLFCNIQYKREAMLRDEIIIKVNSSNIKDNSFALLFTIIRKDDAALISLGKQIVSFCNSKKTEPLNLPQHFIQNVLKLIEVDEKSLLFKY